MNVTSQLPTRTQNHHPHGNQNLTCERAETLREEEWQLHNECIALAREALDLYKAQGEKRLKAYKVSTFRMQRVNPSGSGRASPPPRLP